MALKGPLLLPRLVLLGAVCATCFSCGRDGQEAVQDAGPPSSSLHLFAAEPVPPGCRDELSRLRDLHEKGSPAEITKAYPGFLNCLSESWGGKKNVRVCVYHYNYCLARKNSDEPAIVIQEIGQGLKAWPESFRHRVLLASTLIETGMAGAPLPDGSAVSINELLVPAYYPLLREMKIAPGALHLQWAALCLMRKRLEDGLRHAQGALDLRPGWFDARRLKARLLIALQRGRDANILARQLVKERPGDRVLEMLLLGTCLEIGEHREAVELYTRLQAALEKNPQAGGLPLSLRVKVAAGFNSLKRYSEARAVLLKVLMEDPEDSDALSKMGVSLRGLGLSSAGQAVISRSKELHAYYYDLGHAEAAGRQGRYAQFAYNKARAFSELDRLGDAHTLLQTVFKRKGMPEDLQLVREEVLLRLGRSGEIIEELEQASASADFPDLLQASLARLKLHAGDREAAVKITASLRKGLEARLKKSPRLGTRLLRIARESGDLKEVSSLLEFLEGAGGSSGESPEAVMLCRAELLLREGKQEEASTLLSRNYRMLEGGEIWAGALRLLAGSPGADPGNTPAVEDCSDLLDHPEVAAAAVDFKIVTSSPALSKLIGRVRELTRLRGEILSRMRGFGDADILPLWHELLGLYLENGAARKARETAWYLWSRDPGGLEVSLDLARALSRDEEILTRLYVLKKGLERNPGEPALGALQRKGLLFLGVGE